MDLSNLKSLSRDELAKRASDMDLSPSDEQSKSDLILQIVRGHHKSGGAVTCTGVLEILSDGFGFLRGLDADFSHSPEDIYVSPSQIRRFHLNTGDKVQGQVRPPKESERYFALLRVESINGLSTDKGSAAANKGFADRKVVHPSERIRLSSDDPAVTLFDKLVPIAKGQRALLFAPTGCGASELLMGLATAASKSAKLKTTCVLLSERPETIQDFKDAGCKELVTSTFDEQAPRHLQLAEMVIENAKRQAESGSDVFLVVDSLTRLATAASVGTPGSSANLPHGLTPRGVAATKKLLSVARNLEGSGSITMLAVLRSSGSAIDSYLAQELGEVANCRVQLSREARAVGAPLPLDLERTDTEYEEHFLSDEERAAVAALRARAAKDPAELAAIAG